MADDTFAVVSGIAAFLGLVVIVALGQTLDLPVLAQLGLAAALGLALRGARTMRVRRSPASPMRRRR